MLMSSTLIRNLTSRCVPSLDIKDQQFVLHVGVWNWGEPGCEGDLGVATSQWLVGRSWSCGHLVCTCCRKMQITDLEGGYMLIWTFHRQYETR